MIIIQSGELGTFKTVDNMLKITFLFSERDLFGAIVNLLPHELLMYYEPLAYLVFITNIYWGIFYQIYLLPQLTIFFF